MPVERGLAWINGLKLEGAAATIAGEVVKEIRARLGFLNDVGLNYLTLSRAAKTLSGGEAQRIRLATQIGSGLVGVMYVLDEPSIGLHQRDNARLIETLHHLRWVEDARVQRCQDNYEEMLVLLLCHLLISFHRELTREHILKNTDRIDRAHGAIDIKICAACYDHSTCNFGYHTLQKMIGHKQHFHLCIDLFACFICIV